VSVATLILAGSPNEAVSAEPDAPAAPVYSWQKPDAKVLPNGVLEWAPQPFVFEKGDSVRYIDFEGGDDTKDGLTPQSAWKHHPWDDHALGAAHACKGIQTYVFKGGVVYRGALKATESGASGNPIRLTSDPTWGNGAAIFYGSARIKGEWKKANAQEAPGIPHPDEVWYIDLAKDSNPDLAGAKCSAIWQIDGDKVERLHIARMPKYDLSDPNNPAQNWPTWSAYDKNTGTLTSPVLKGLGDKTLLDGAVIWSESDFLMGSARKMKADWTYDPIAGSITSPLLTNSRWFNHIPRAQVHFMIENVRQFFDTPGEYFFDLHGTNPERLYLWPPAGTDPNRVMYEVATTRFPLSISGQHDIVISGLEFRYNDPDEDNPSDFSISQAWAPPRFSVSEGTTSPCVSIIGNCANITVKNCKFYYVADAVQAAPDYLNTQPGTEPGELDNIIVSDNDIQHVDLGGAVSLLGDNSRTKGIEYTQLKHAEVLRNRVIDTGFRHGVSPWSSIPAISVAFPETCEIAGNIIDTSFGNGIITYGGKMSGSSAVAPLTRILVHDNQIDNTMLGVNDYGGLENFQGGPVYIYNNVIRNAVGKKFFASELGYNLYLDGGFKCYAFNNIIVGNVKADHPDYYNNCGYFMVFGFMDQFFNNTIYHFNKAMDGSSGNRSNILGNLMLDCKSSFIRQNRPGDVSMLGGGDTGEMGRSGIPTMAYASNVFFGDPKSFGDVAGISNKGSGTGAPVESGNTLDELRDKLQAGKCRLSSIGWKVTEPPLADPVHQDYRPTPDSGVKERGLKYFVPWALARNVGEWNFYKSVSNPQVVLGEGFYMTDEYTDRDMYYFIPRNDLTVSNCSAEDYVAGPLEDWIEGALAFDGRDRVASISQAELTKSMNYPAGTHSEAATYDGSKRETLDMAANNFLIEIVFKTEPRFTNGVLVSKLDRSGYELSIGADGGACLKIQGGAAMASAASTIKVNDGNWHHLIAEVDRAAGKTTLYVDGKAAGQGNLDGIAKDAALSNDADFVVGKGFVGAIDFLRVCRSTLSESKTTIDELYAWEFNGPFLRDFTGHSPANGKRDAGAIDMDSTR